MMALVASPTADTKASALDRLAALCGIAAKSEDAKGNEHVTTPELKRAVLRAMGLKAGTDEEAEEALRQGEAREWQRPLPPVLVAYSGKGPVAVPLVLPEGAGEIRWTLTLEDGSRSQGEARAAELPVLEEHVLDGRLLQRRSLELGDAIPWGYHRLQLEGEARTLTLIVTPGTCWLPGESPEDLKLWGIAAQVYLLRSEHNWGIGDYTDLRRLVDWTKGLGGDVVGVNPVHAMFLDKPEDASPYSPSDRLLLNVLNIDVERIPELADSAEARALIGSAEFQDRLRTARAAKLVDYQAAADLKVPVLRLLFASFEEKKDEARQAELEAFHAERREMLDRACLFQALRAHFAEQDPARADCSHWPEEYRTSRAEGAQRFAQEQAGKVRFQLWLQWIADTQLREARDAAAGMKVGIYRDLAVGAHAEGAEVWSHPEMLVSGASVGAPPDLLNAAGQDWGLPPMHPQRAREAAYCNFIELVRANMRYAGGLRIDHAMALLRLYWVPSGNDAKEGVYVHYPIEDLVGILALESQRNHCLVIGEDMGTVPEGFRERMAEARVLSYRLLFFERDDKAFHATRNYPLLALAVAGSHDLPTLRGWWQEGDIAAKERLGMLPGEDGPEKARAERQQDREALVARLREEGLLDTEDGMPDLDTFCDAASRFLGRTRSLLTLLQIDDLTEECEQVNIPGAPGEHPNWRRRLSLTLEEIQTNPRVLQAVKDVQKERAGS